VTGVIKLDQLYLAKISSGIDKDLILDWQAV
jgi:hypothetical protein